MIQITNVPFRVRHHGYEHFGIEWPELMEENRPSGELRVTSYTPHDSQYTGDWFFAARLIGKQVIEITASCGDISTTHIINAVDDVELS